MTAPAVTDFAAAAPARSDAASARDDDAAGRKNLLLLVQLRWIAVGGQVVTIAVVRFGLGVGLPFGPMAAVLACLVALNVCSLLRLTRPTPVGNPSCSRRCCSTWRR